MTTFVDIAPGSGASAEEWRRYDLLMADALMQKAERQRWDLDKLSAGLLGLAMWARLGLGLYGGTEVN